MPNFERLFLVSIISAHFAPEIAALGFAPADRAQAIGAIAIGLIAAYHAVFHIGWLYLRLWMKARNIPLPEELENPTSPPRAANP